MYMAKKAKYICGRCEREKAGTVSSYSRPHDREQPKCIFHGKPVDRKTYTISTRKMQAERSRGSASSSSSGNAPKAKAKAKAKAQVLPRKILRKESASEILDDSAEAIGEEKSKGKAPGSEPGSAGVPRATPPRYQNSGDTQDPTRNDAASLPDRPEDRTLLMEIARCSGIADRPGYTLFFDISDHTLLPNREIAPPQMVADIQSLWNMDARFDVVYIQVARQPLTRRLASPHCRDEDAPWRKTILLTEKGTVRVEEWQKIQGPNSKIRKEER